MRDVHAFTRFMVMFCVLTGCVVSQDAEGEVELDEINQPAPSFGATGATLFNAATNTAPGECLYCFSNYHATCGISLTRPHYDPSDELVSTGRVYGSAWCNLSGRMYWNLNLERKVCGFWGCNYEERGGLFLATENNHATGASGYMSWLLDQGCHRYRVRSTIESISPVDGGNMHYLGFEPTSVQYFSEEIELCR